MSDSILNSTKKVLGLGEDYTPFDLDIIMHINSVFSTLSQLGVGPVDGFEITDESATWDTFLLDNPRFNFVKSYMVLSVRMLFDPPSTSYTQTAFKEMKEQYEWRISALRESGAWIPGVETPIELDGGNAVGG